MADLDEEVSPPSDVVWNRCLRDLANRLETMGRTMTDFGLPEPADDTTELAREHLRWDRRSCQGFVDALLPLLTPDEQLPIYEEVSDGVCRAYTHTLNSDHTLYCTNAITSNSMTQSHYIELTHNRYYRDAKVIFRLFPHVLHHPTRRSWKLCDNDGLF